LTRADPSMSDQNLFRGLPWEPRDPRTILVKIAWFELTSGARETPMLKPLSRKLAREGLLARRPLSGGRIALSLTPAGRDFLIGSLLENAVGRPLTGSVVRWTEARYVQRLLAAADVHEDL